MDLVWDITVHCWDQDPAQRPTMVEVVIPIREWLVLSPYEWNQCHDMFLVQLQGGHLDDQDHRYSSQGLNQHHPTTL